MAALSAPYLEPAKQPIQRAALAGCRSRVQGAALQLALAAVVAAVPASAHALALIGAASLTSVQSTDSSATLSSDLDTGDWFAQSSAGASYASALVDEGVGRAFTSTLPADGGTRSASTSIEWYVTLNNNSASAVTFAAGAFSAEWSFSLGKVDSSASSARFAASSSGLLDVGGNGALVSYRQFDETGAPAPYVLGTGQRSGPGSFEVLAASETAFRARAASGELVLLPDQEARVTVTFITSVVAGAGWAGTIDATRSVDLRVELPAGVTLDSPRPLSFVTTVPEPPVAALALLGLLAVAGKVRRRRQPASRA
jgi:MYXO-CTERM domain-containing protein